MDTVSPDILWRAFAAEALLIGFRRVQDEVVGFEPGRNVHGEMGSVEAWQQEPLVRRALVSGLDSSRDELLAAASALLAGTRAAERLTGESLVDWACTRLPSLVDAAATDAKVADLSEALAQAGRLPMFGFPTQVRVLWTQRPSVRREPQTLDRDADMALSEFAPGSEVVKDKAIHTAAGLAHFIQAGDGYWREVDDPMGPRRQAGLCSSCLTVQFESQTETCPVCGSSSPDFRREDIVEPLGYRTTFTRRDYEQLGEATSRASQPRLAMPPDVEAQTIANAKVRGGNAEVVVVNDNRGALYTFGRHERATDSGPRAEAGLLEEGLLSSPTRRRRLRMSRLSPAADPLDPVALAARRRTDVLTIGLAAEPSGIRIGPSTPAGRAAWGSLGFLVRRVAADWLSVGPDEIEVGVHATQSPDGLANGEVFLADALENGAGYSRWMRDRIPDLFERSEGAAEELERHSTAEGQPCDSSCYQCLRDYWNRGWHPLLDWRLARDLLSLLKTGEVDVERSWRGLEGLAGALARDFGLDVDDSEGVPVLARVSNGRRLAVLHPFEDVRDDVGSPRVGRLREDPGLRTTTWFELVRRPGYVVGRLLA